MHDASMVSDSIHVHVADNQKEICLTLKMTD